eukprot:2332960-Amphidinium_carterae.4
MSCRGEAHECRVSWPRAHSKRQVQLEAQVTATMLQGTVAESLQEGHELNEDLQEPGSWPLDSPLQPLSRRGTLIHKVLLWNLVLLLSNIPCMRFTVETPRYRKMEDAQSLNGLPLRARILLLYLDAQVTAISCPFNAGNAAVLDIAIKGADGFALSSSISTLPWGVPAEEN